MANDRKAFVEDCAASSPDELQVKLLEKKKELFNIRFQHATGQLENVSTLGQLKKEIAVIKTMMREQDLGIRIIPSASPAPTEQSAEKKKGLRGRKKAAQEGEE